MGIRASTSLFQLLIPVLHSEVEMVELELEEGRVHPPQTVSPFHLQDQLPVHWKPLHHWHENELAAILILNLRLSQNPSDDLAGLVNIL